MQLNIPVRGSGQEATLALSKKQGKVRKFLEEAYGKVPYAKETD
jgi:hypothetical protein